MGSLKRNPVFQMYTYTVYFTSIAVVDVVIIIIVVVVVVVIVVAKAYSWYACSFPSSWKVNNHPTALLNKNIYNY